MVLSVMKRATCHPPIFLIVLDTCMDDDDLQAVKVRGKVLTVNIAFDVY